MKRAVRSLMCSARAIRLRRSNNSAHADTATWSLARFKGTSSQKSTGSAVSLNEADFTALAQNLADISAARQPFSGGLRALAEETPSRRLQRGLIQVADHIDAGMPLEEILAKRISGFPPHLAGLVLAGIKAGCLDHVLQESLVFTMRATSLRRRVKLALAYPMILAAVLSMLLLFIFVFIVPNFQRIVMDFEVRMPWLTELIFGMSNLLHRQGLYLILGGVVVAGVLWGIGRSMLGRAGMRRIISKIPLFGGMLRSSALMEYCHLLAILIESRMPLPKALRYAAGGVHDADLAEASRQLADDVEGGQPFAWTVGSFSQFPAIYRQFVKFGERQNAYPVALHAAGDVFESRARVQASLFLWLFEPFMICLVAFMTGLVLFALYWPMIRLLDQLS